MDGVLVVGAYFQPNLSSRMLLCDAKQMDHNLAAKTMPAVTPGDTHIHNVAPAVLISHNTVTNYFPFNLQNPARITQTQHLPHCPGRPGKFIALPLDFYHPAKIGFIHRSNMYGFFLICIAHPTCKLLKHCRSIQLYFRCDNWRQSVKTGGTASFTL